MLSYITVRNFGCFDDHEYKVDFNKLNVVVGTNNSGKSTLFKGLNFTKWVAYTNRINWNTAHYLLQSFNEAVYGHDLARTITIRVGYQLGSNQWHSYLGITRDNLQQNQFLRNRDVISNITHPDHHRFLEKIWYFSPNRTPISYREDVHGIGGALQPLQPSGSDIKQYLLERWTGRDENWTEVEKWFKKIDPQLSILKTPLYGNQVSLETDRNDGTTATSVNLSLQGSGVQNTATIISGIMFSPKGSTIIIEEPENFLNSRSIEVLVDLFNHAVNELDKQIIIATHSWEIIKAYCSDIGKGEERGKNHVKAKQEDFKLIALTEKLGSDKIQEVNLKEMKFSDVRDYFKQLWG